MTKARARAADDEGDSDARLVDPVLACLGPVRTAPRELHCNPTAADGRAACKLFMRGKWCREDCQYAHDPPSCRPQCWTFDRYGVCPRDIAMEKDPESTPCWFPHVAPDELPDNRKPHVALQCELGVADRVASRCRELLGENSVVDAARLNLARAGDCVIFVRSDELDEVEVGSDGVDTTRREPKPSVANTMRRLSSDPHLLQTLKRAYSVGVEGIDVSGTLGAGYTTVTGTSKETLLKNVSESIPTLLRSTFTQTKMKIKARCFPKWCSDVTCSSIEPVDGKDLKLYSPTAKDPSHYLDVVCVKNRAHLTLWPCGFVEGGGKKIEGEERIDDSGEENDDTVDVSSTSTILPYPELPNPGHTTLEYLVTQHCERVKEARSDKKPMCRAYFKVEEAAYRCEIPISKKWQCVDVGAAPGGWTQWISDRLVMLERNEGGLKGSFNRYQEVSATDQNNRGTVWAIDPGALTLNPFPENVKHIRMMAEKAIADDEVPRENISMLVCDANAAPEVVTSILLTVKPALKPGAYLVTTFKNFCRGYLQWRSQMKAARDEFEKNGFSEVLFFHSFANCPQEFTYVARFKGNRTS